MHKPVSILLLCLGLSRGGSCTLVLAAASKEGIVICADKRRVIAATHAAKDDSKKLMRAGQNGVFWETGQAAEVEDLASGKPAWSLLDLARHYFDLHQASFEPELIQPFFSLVLNDYRRFLATAVGRGFDPTSLDFQAQMIFCYRKSDGHFYVYRGALWKRPGQNATVEADGEYANQFDTSRMHVFGEPAIKDELTSGNNPSYEDLRRDAEVMSIVRGGNRPNSLESATLEAVLRKLIVRMSQGVGKLKGAESVSAACDCYIVPQTGTARILSRR